MTIHILGLFFQVFVSDDLYIYFSETYLYIHVQVPVYLLVHSFCFIALRFYILNLQIISDDDFFKSKPL